jgi:hypothetical protein
MRQRIRGSLRERKEGRRRDEDEGWERKKGEGTGAEERGWEGGKGKETRKGGKRRGMDQKGGSHKAPGSQLGSTVNISR